MKQSAAIVVLLCCLSLSLASPIELPKFQLPKIQIPFDIKDITVPIVIGKLINPTVVSRESLQAPGVKGQTLSKTFTFTSVSRAIEIALPKNVLDSILGSFWHSSLKVS